MKLDKNKISGLIATLLFHAGAVLLLLILALRTPLPLPGEEGVEVNIGYADVGMGDVQKKQPPKQQDTPPPPPPKAQETPPAAEEELVTENNEETPALKDVDKEKKEEEKKKEKPVEEKEVQKPDPEPEPEEKPTETPVEEEETKPVEPEKPKVNQKALFKGQSDSDTEGQSQGETTDAGDQGSPFGTPDSENYEGEGGQGNGISFSLTGRKAKHLPKPDYKSEDQGKVVVTIYVNKYGNVTRADAGAKGTTVTDTRLHRLAEQAALRAKFSTDPEAPEVQKGTITYNFIRMN